MYKEDVLEKAKACEEEWEKKSKKIYEKKMGVNLSGFKTNSNIPIKYVYGPQDVNEQSENFGMPGVYPYTRGLYPLTYQYTPWMTQFLHGYGLPDHTRERMEKLLKEGMAAGKGILAFNVECDLATAHGYDPDSNLVKGAVGVSGVTVSKMEDLEILFNGFDLAKTRVVLTTKGINDLAILGMYIVYGKKRGYEPAMLMGQSQNRVKNSFITSNVRGFLPQNQLKLQVELIKYATLNMPSWNHTNLCGYNLRETGITAVQEVAFTLAEVIELIEEGIKAGLDPDDFVSRFSTQLAIGMDFFEEVVKFRAFRKIWAKVMKERFNCKKEKSFMLRVHAHTAGSSLTAQQPLNNIIRTTLEALSAALGGVQSMHTSSYDEAINLPSEEAVTTALRVNQILQHESGITRVSDPLGGSYFIESLTGQMEEEILKIINEIEERGGFTKCMVTGWFKDQMETESYTWREKVRKGEITIVGLNKYKKEEEFDVPVFTLEQEKTEKIAVERIKKWKQNRDNSAVKSALLKVKERAKEFETIEQAGILMPAVLKAMEAKCTIGEVTEALFEILGTVYP